MKKTLNFFAVALLLLFASCKEKNSITPTSSLSNELYVINEGAFGVGNGNLTVYNTSDNSTLSTPIEDANGTTLGDVPQSAYSIGDEVWIPINASNKILIIDPQNFTIVEQIINIVTPRFGCVYGDHFYIGSAFGNEFYKIDIATRNVETYILSTSGVTDMIAYDGKILFTASDTANSSLLAFDTLSSSITSVVDMDNANAPKVIVRSSDNIYVLSGNSWLGVDFKISKISNNLTTSTTYDLPSGEYASIEEYNGDVYILANDYASTGGPNGVFKLNIGGSASLESVVSTPSDVSTFYSFGIDPKSGEIYTSDAKNYVDLGDVYRYSNSGTFLDRFEAGLIPSFFLFR